MKTIRRWSIRAKALGPESLMDHLPRRAWTPREKLRLVKKVMRGRSVNSVSAEAGIENADLNRWIRAYGESGLDGLKSHAGRKKTMPSEEEPAKKRKSPGKRGRKSVADLEARNKELEKKNEKLMAEVAYLKKVRALASRRAAGAKASRRKPSGRS